MSTLEEVVQFFYDDQYIVEMSNIQPKTSGLPYVVNLIGKGVAKHGARVKVSNVKGTFHPTDNFSVTLEPTPRIVGTCKIKSDELDHVLDWIQTNREHIMHVWNNYGTMSGTDVDAGIKKL